MWMVRVCFVTPWVSQSWQREMAERHTACEIFKIMCAALARSRWKVAPVPIENHPASAVCVLIPNSSRHRIDTLRRFAPQKTFRHFLFGKLNYYWLRKLIRARIFACSFGQDRRRSVVSGVPFILCFTILRDFVPKMSLSLLCVSPKRLQRFFFLRIEIRDSKWNAHSARHTRPPGDTVMLDGCIRTYILCGIELSSPCIWASWLYCYSVWVRHSTMWWGSFVRTANICTNHTDAKLTFQENDATTTTHMKNG